MEALETELLAELRANASAAWSALEVRGRLHEDAVPPDLELPGAFAETLASAIALEENEGTGRAALLRQHYLDRMPRARVAQVATRDEPNATLFHTRLQPERLPRLVRALERLHAIVGDALPAPRDLFERFPTLARLHGATHYGGFMPLLHGTPADLARAARAVPDIGVQAAIDRHLCAAILHELTHLGRQRGARLPLHLDECVAAHLGVVAHPPLAFPGPDDEDGLYAAPWLAQVGQALARVVGLPALVDAHAGRRAWEDVLPPGLLENAQRLAWDDYRERRGPHFLSDSFAPDPWLKLIFGARGSRAALDATPWSAVRVPPDDDAADEAIFADAMRAMCLENVLEEGSFRVRSRVPAAPVRVEVAARRVTTAARPGETGPAPAHLFPPGAARCLETVGITECSVVIEDVAQIPRLATVLEQPYRWRAYSS